MAYPTEYVRYLNFPKIPQEIIDNINWNFNEYERKSLSRNGFWSDSFNNEINQWCQANICTNVYFAFQVFDSNLFIHCDQPTKTKLLYLLQPGGEKVVTEFFDDEHGTNLLASYEIPLFTWALLKVDQPHRAYGIDPGKLRVGIIGTIFN